jgi:hypothetical protein
MTRLFVAGVVTKPPATRSLNDSSTPEIRLA